MGEHTECDRSATGVGGKQLVVLGSGTSLRFAPFEDAACLFWGPAELYGKVPRLDVGFALYPEAHLRRAQLWDPLITIPIPVYMSEAFPGLPTARRYPLDAVRAMFTVSGRDKPFLTNTISYVLAFALLQEPLPSEIRVFGADMVQDTEYEGQRPSCEFFLGVAWGYGIPLYLHPVSDLLKTPFLYGYEEAARDTAAQELHERRTWFRLQRDRAIEDAQAALTRVVHHNAALGDVAYFLKRAQR